MERDDLETLRTEAPGVGDEHDEGRPSARDLKTFRKVEERFEIGEELGRGGMGRVLEAKDVALRRQVAIKQVLGTTEHDLFRFEREVRITAELEHPSIVPIHDIGTDALGRPYYVMRRIRGRPLAERLASLPEMRSRLALLPNLLAAVDAAAFAHARRIIHRDIKPSNILLGDYGETLLIDWGLARRIDEPDDVVPVIPDAAASLPGDQLTHTGHVYGTTGYMAPEQARGEHVDARADVFALGATLFHVLHGRGPFDGVSAAERISAAALDEPPPLDKLPADAPPDLRAIVTKAMATDPAARYPDAGALAGDLRAFLEGRLVAAHSYTAGERAVRFVRRHRTAVTVAALALALFIGGTIFAFQRILRQVDRADQAEHESEEKTKFVQDRNDNLLLARASKLADLDPALAIAVLKHLPDRSTYWWRARDIAAKAAAKGIPHGVRVHQSAIYGLAISPAGWIASSDERGLVAIHDLKTARKHHEKRFPATVRHLGWIDGGQTLVVGARGLTLIDMKSRAERVIDADREVHQLVIDGDRIRYVDKSFQLIEVTPATGSSRVVARDVHAAATAAGKWLVSGPKGTRLLVGDREIRLTDKEAMMNVCLAVSPDGSRVAASLRDDEVIEWDADGKELARWAIRVPFHLIYTNALYVVNLNNVITRLGPTLQEVARLKQPVVAMERTAVGAAFVQMSGRVLIVDAIGAREFSFPMMGTTRIAGHASSSTLATATKSGELRWVDLAAISPVPEHVPHFTSCFVDSEKIYVFQDLDLIAIDRKTRARTVIATNQLSFSLTACVGLVSRNTLAVVGPTGRLALIDFKTGGITTLEDDPTLFLEDTTETVFVGRKRDLIAVVGGKPPGKVIWRAPSDIVALSAAKGWIVASLADGSMVRIDRATGAQVATTSFPTGSFKVATDGVVWHAYENTLWRWDGGVPVKVGEGQAIIRELGSRDANPLVVLKADGSLWTASASQSGMYRIAAMGRPLALGTKDVVAVEENNALITLMAASGERIVRELPRHVVVSRFARDGRTLFVALADYFLLYEDPVPEDPVLVREWIMAPTTTNAFVADANSDVLDWR